MIEFALAYSEYSKMEPTDAYKLVKKAAKKVYSTEKYHRRGEFGELYLHTILREIYNTEPAVSKIFYKDSENDTVKGFDCVHISVTQDDEIELWIGEVKFYQDIDDAISKVIPEIKDHVQTDYLKSEFSIILDKVDPKWPHSEKFQQLLDPNTKLEDIFSRACIPILLTYNSPALIDYERIKEEYKEKLSQELVKHFENFNNKYQVNEIRIHLILLPLQDKSQLLEKCHEALKSCQV